MGERTTIWNNIRGATNEASPSTNTAMGIPRLAELTYPDESAPTVNSGTARFNHSRAITM